MTKLSHFQVAVALVDGILQYRYCIYFSVFTKSNFMQLDRIYTQSVKCCCKVKLSKTETILPVSHG